MHKFIIESEGQQSESPWPDYCPPADTTELFITISLPNKQYYKKYGRWEDMFPQEQKQFIREYLESSIHELKRVGIHEKKYTIYELNKQNNIHLHGIMFLDNNLNWDYNLATIQKLIQRQLKCGCYGIKIERIKDIKNVLKYCNKQQQDMKYIAYI